MEMGAIFIYVVAFSVVDQFFQNEGTRLIFWSQKLIWLLQWGWGQG